MKAYLTSWRRLKSDRRAVTALEYGLIAALIAGVMITGVTTLGSNLNLKFAAIASTVGVSGT